MRYEPYLHEHQSTQSPSTVLAADVIEDQVSDDRSYEEVTIHTSKTRVSVNQWIVLMQSLRSSNESRLSVIDGCHYQRSRSQPFLLRSPLR